MCHEFDETREYHRGEIYFADLKPVFRHEQGGVRPVLILQNDIGNFYAPTLIVTAATSRCFKRLDMPTHIVFNDAEGLEPSMFMLEFIRTINKHRLRSYAGKLTEEQMKKIDHALRISLNLNEDDFLPIEMEAP